MQSRTTWKSRFEHQLGAVGIGQHFWHHVQLFVISLAMAVAKHMTGCHPRYPFIWPHSMVIVAWWMTELRPVARDRTSSKWKQIRIKYAMHSALILNGFCVANIYLHGKVQHHTQCVMASFFKQSIDQRHLSVTNDGDSIDLSVQLSNAVAKKPYRCGMFVLAINRFARNPSVQGWIPAHTHTLSVMSWCINDCSP